MTRIEELLNNFREIAYHPEKQMAKYKEEGKKLIGCFPYYIPEEIVYAAGMVPFGVWGTHGTISRAKEYFASFYCTIAQMSLEMALEGKLDGLSGVILSSMCDTLRPLTQNFKVAIPQLPFMFLAHPQNRKPEYGIKYTMNEFTRLKGQLEEIAGHKIEDEKLHEAFKVYNESRATRREFVKLAGKHPEVISAVSRSAVLKSAFFMLKDEHTAMLKELNNELAKLPEVKWNGVKVLTSGIILDNPTLLGLFDEYKIAIVADDVAHESRAFTTDVPMDIEDPIRALAVQFANQDNDTILYDPLIEERPKYVARKAKEAGADGVVIAMMQFCDPEELEYPSLRKALNEAGLPHIKFGFDQQMVDFGQARTSLQAFAESL
ncbi:MULTISPECIES: 2-hydroxyacyl-CoA dehydratase subunit D [Fusobacterium]|uniref:2-hydroxyacyl-CoA dehydratase subunit D n=1 Tax=Fusobacterium TaxID=848 RepID=UPI00147701F6|nr:MULTISPECIES: 2-hydroxyacyl-CoA dehydratase [Fusobacterium]NME36819.1 2-hydroxyacyl-CoA dehydratase [Fusobacterium sp. FSA-380-WT-3A]